MNATGSISRRTATRMLAGAAISVASGFAISPGLAGQQGRGRRTVAPTQTDLSAADFTFLDEMQRAACLFFLEQASPKTGQVLDRAVNRTSTGSRDPRRVASIAATGFGLTGLCIAHSRGYVSRRAALDRARTTLDFHLNKLPHEHGFFYHFNDVQTGQPMRWTEVSSIDTSILLCGMLTCRAYFADRRVTELATAIYNRVEWPWMLNGGTTFSMGWRQETGFLSSRWNHYCELMMLYLLAIGSLTHPVSSDLWDNFTRPHVRFGEFDYISGHDPLFVHQYSHAWFNFAGQRDTYADYFENSITATRAHKAFCLSLKRGYTNDYWGVSASDWQHGYTAWGGPPLMGPVDGSVVPAATAGSLPFLAADCVRVLRSLKEHYGKDAWGRYGFCDAFHPQQFWYDPDVLGIDLGIGLVMAENLRSGLVWKTFMRNPEIGAAMQLCGFHASSPSAVGSLGKDQAEIGEGFELQRIACRV